MKHFRIRNGEWPTRTTVAVREIEAMVAPRAAALLGADMPGLRALFEVEEGAQVAVGQTLLRDRRHPAVAYVSPISGRVSRLAYGPRRTLSACIVEADATESAAEGDRPVDAEFQDAPRAVLLERGLWPAFRTRPFGRTPVPDATPFAIFVNAVHAIPDAPDPMVVLADQKEAFHLGVTILKGLTAGNVFVCQSAGAPLGPSEDRVVPASFSGSMAAGLASTHVDLLCPVGAGRDVWTIGHQDVAAIGHLFQTGRYRPERVVSIGGPAAGRARVIRTCLGADINSVVGAQTGEAQIVEALSGTENFGRAAAYLGRFDDQITVVSETPQPAPVPSRPWLKGFNPAPSALIPTHALERALAVDVLAIPLLRALSVQDSEAAEKLGCLALVEEDVAALSRHCTSGADYAVLLRRVLDDLAEDAA